MKKRLQNYISSIIGALIMLSSLGMYVAHKFYEFEFTNMEMITMLVLGWIFLMAKDTLIEGLFLNIFKIKKDA